MDNITVIVEDYPQEITVQVTTTGITVDQANQIVANTQKVGYTDALVSNNVSVVNNTAKVGITSLQANEIIANNSKVGITPTQANNIVTNNAKVGITTSQTNDIIANNGKVGITVQQASDIVTNNSKVGITPIQTSDITTNNAKVSDVNHVAIELPNADNTSDVNKPISIATQSALDLKVDKTENELNTENIFKSVSFTMDYSDRVKDDSGTIESRECVMN